MSISSFRGAQDRVRPGQDVSSQGEAETVPHRRADETILQPGQLIHAFVIPTVVEAPSDLLLDDVRAGYCEMGRDRKRHRARAVVERHRLGKGLGDGGDLLGEGQSTFPRELRDPISNPTPPPLLVDALPRA